MLSHYLGSKFLELYYTSKKFTSAESIGEDGDGSKEDAPIPILPFLRSFENSFVDFRGFLDKRDLLKTKDTSFRQRVTCGPTEWWVDGVRGGNESQMEKTRNKWLVLSDVIAPTMSMVFLRQRKLESFTEETRKMPRNGFEDKPKILLSVATIYRRNLWSSRTFTIIRFLNNRCIHGDWQNSL